MFLGSLYSWLDGLCDDRFLFGAPYQRSLSMIADHAAREMLAVAWFCLHVLAGGTSPRNCGRSGIAMKPAPCTDRHLQAK
jgi:hypothetical protein